MLNFIRERAQGWVAWFIVGLISIPFALWGVNSYLTVATDQVVAKVNGEPIQQTEYQWALQQYRDKMRARLQDKFDPTDFDSIVIKQTVLEGLIEKKLLTLSSVDIGQQVSNLRLINEIKSTPAFQKEGQFDSQLYARLLARAGLTPNRFEGQLRSDILNQEMIQSVQGSAIVADNNFRHMQRLQSQSRQIAYGVIGTQLADIEVTESEVQAYYAKHLDNYRSPEQISIDYIELSVDKLIDQIEFDEADLQLFYQENKAQFVGPEQRQISHILLASGESDAEQMVATIKTRLQAGEAFAALAAEFSQDPGSANEGGNLGLYQRKDIDPAFEQAVFDKMEPGDVSDLLKSEYGYHLVQLTKVQVGAGQSYADAKQEVEALYRRQQAEQLFFEQAEQLADLSYENPDDLLTVAEALALTIETSPSFTRNGGSGIAQHRKVVNAAFGEDVLVNDLNSPVIELTNTHLLVIHKNNYIAEVQLPLAAVTPAISEQLRYQAARNQARINGEEILTELRLGTAPAELFAQDDWHSPQIVTRTNNAINSQVLEKAFSMAKPDEKPRYAGFSASNGNYIIVELSDVVEGNTDPNEELNNYLLQTYKNSELQAFIASLKEDADIEIFAHLL